MARSQVLELLVENEWVVESLKALGGGHMLHLSFANEQVEPSTMAALKRGLAGELGEILEMGPELRRVAVFELCRFNEFKDYVRLDFRLLSVTPFLRRGKQADGHKYRCRLRKLQEEIFAG